MKVNSIFKKAASLLLAIFMIFSACVIAAAEEVPLSTPDFITTSGGLYAHCAENSANAWQKWSSYNGMNAESGVMYFFLPASARDSQVEIFNNFTNDVTVGSAAIPAQTTKAVAYTPNQKLTVRNGNRSYTLIIRKSDAEASVFVNDSRTSFTDYTGKTVYSDLYSFLIQNKENSAAGSSVSIVGKNGAVDTTLKKIKGRGNTNWRETDKKPFNLTFNSATTIGHTSGKKFSFVSNAKDSTLLRNTIMYDLASEVGSPYAPNTSFVDFYVNGEYRGLYIACDKVDLGKNSLVSLKDESDKLDSDFNFLVEVDVWNYQNDVYFVSDKGYHVVLKTPDLDGYDPSDASMKAKYDYIKSTYQRLENAMYNGSLSDLEQICDLDSLASMYLLQDFGKNCDGGYTSTYFTYNAAEDKFYAAPIWDCDSTLGAVDCLRDGCSNSTCSVSGWTTRTAVYNHTVNPYGKAFTTKGLTAEGKTFEDIVKEVWTQRFMPAIDTLCGRAASSGRLKSIDTYAAAIEKSGYNNYIMWDFMWNCAAYRNTGLSRNYSRDYAGELQYMKDWTTARTNWVNSTLTDEEPITPITPIDTSRSYYLTGIEFGGWNATLEENKLTSNPDGTASIEFDFKKDTTYTFKVIDSYGNYYDPNFDDAKTSAFLTPKGSHGNASITPTKDTLLKITLKNGMFVAESAPRIGDFDRNGTVDINDASAIQLALLRNTVFNSEEKLYGDADRNGKLSIRDVTMIQLYLVGRVKKL